METTAETTAETRAGDVVRSAYDAQARTYAGQVRMQSGNLSRLLEYLAAEAVELPLGCWLDAGCGTGIAASAVAFGAGSGRSYWGTDLSPGMIGVARGRLAADAVGGDVARRQPDGLGAGHGGGGARVTAAGDGGLGAIRFEVADLRSLPCPTGSQDVILCNSVLHWLNVPSGSPAAPAAALVEMARVARPGAWLALSVAGIGTARRFQAAWREAMSAWADGLPTASPRPTWPLDPIGAMTLDAVVSAALSAGFAITSARLDYEPVVYDTTADYAVDVAAYGYGIYLAAVPAPQRAAVWSDVVARFKAAHAAADAAAHAAAHDAAHDAAYAAEAGVGAYVHDQYMIYLIGRRRAGQKALP